MSPMPEQRAPTSSAHLTSYGEIYLEIYNVPNCALNLYHIMTVYYLIGPFEAFNNLTNGLYSDPAIRRL